MRLPTGTVTFLFTDVEGSTRLLLELGAERYAKALAEHRRLLRKAASSQGGVELGTEGDGSFFAFPTAPGAVAAAAEAQEAFASGSIHVRMGLHTGTPLLTDEGYVGIDVHRAARIAAAGHGGQVLLSAATAALVGTEELKDLGEHRLKDLAAPERVTQLGQREFPPLKSLYRTNLPIPPTPFLGRALELADLVELLNRVEVRLLTLTGPGGTGKTRLALQAAAEAADAFPDGIWWISLAPLRDAALVVPAVAQALGVREERDQPLVELLIARLAGNRALLILDNAEHLLPALAADVVRLRDAGGLKLLLTSRERLRLQGEHVWPVPGLSDADAVALFIASARSLNPSFAPTPAVGDLCARLDNLPLAIELAAARLPLFSPEQLLEHIGMRLDLLKGGRDADPRQQTLRATIDWSYELLSADEQRLFASLSVFAGGCKYEAIQEIATSDPDTLQSLIDKSLVRRREDHAGRPRYSMLETIREYADERLQALGEVETARTRHADHFLAFAEQGARATTPFPEKENQSRSESSRIQWRDEMLIEQPNFARALEWYNRGKQTDNLLRLVAALWRTWESLGRVAHARSWLARSLASADQAEPGLRNDLLLGAGELAMLQGDFRTASSYLEQSLALARSRNDARRTGESLLLMAGVQSATADFGRAEVLYQESADVFASNDYEIGIAVAKVSLAALALAEGDPSEGARLAQEARLLSNRIGWPSGAAWALINEATAEVLQDRPSDALQLIRLGLEMCLELGLPHGVADSFRVIAAALASAGDARVAAHLLAASERLETALEVELGRAERELGRRTLEMLEKRLQSTELKAALDSGRMLTTEQAITYARKHLVAVGA